MEGIETESNTRFAQNYIDSFFTKIPYDSRFNSVQYVKYVPASGLTESISQIDFLIDRRKLECYLLSDLLLECRVTFVEDLPGSGATLPDKSTEVGPVNNALHSLFDSVTVKLNGVQISNSPQNYHYRSYLQTLLTYDNGNKDAQLETVGWVTDTKRFMETECTTQLPYVPKNTGWWNRCNMFKKDGKGGAEYRKEGAVFIGRLNHELTQSSKPLPPETLVQISLHRATNDFFIMKKKGDPKNYKAQLTSICVYIPVANMQQTMLDELMIRWPKEPISYHYRRYNTEILGIQANKKEFTSNRIFAESENPIRVYFFFVRASSAIGTQESNPYNFARSWTYTKSAARLALEDQLQERHTQNELDNIKKMLHIMMHKMEDMQPAQPQPPADPEELPIGRKKGGSPVKRATRSTQQQEEEEETPATGTSGSHSMFSSLANMFRRNSQSPSESDEFEILESAAEFIKKRQKDIEQNKSGSSRASVMSDRQELRDDPTPGPKPPETATFWVESCQLLLNNNFIG